MQHAYNSPIPIFLVYSFSLHFSQTLNLLGKHSSSRKERGRNIQPGSL